MDRDKEKRLDQDLNDETTANDDAIVDEGWKQVDLHDRKKTPEGDLPSDIEPESH